MKKISYSLSIIALLTAMLAACTSTAEKKIEKPETIRFSENVFTGTFVSEGYQEKDKGSDWVSVTITSIRENVFHVEVRSRSDIKKPTCTLTVDAHLTKKGELVASQAGLDVGFRVSGDLLSIYSPSNKELNYFCSGGATLAGDYKRIPGKPDQK
ncbi:hypothetical protein [Fluviicola sp.]|uniref:hypothetical protein n=1 Tax=Fluviicola sp. TaxID=1917219 RepID=UPI002610F3B8|nr:hypothetical protein [Fluviicola sp.]